MQVVSHQHADQLYRAQLPFPGGHHVAGLEAVNNPPIDRSGDIVRASDSTGRPDRQRRQQHLVVAPEHLESPSVEVQTLLVFVKLGVRILHSGEVGHGARSPLEEFEHVHVAAGEAGNVVVVEGQFRSGRSYLRHRGDQTGD